MPSQANLFQAVSLYAKALNPRLQVAQDGLAWTILQATSMSAADISTKIDTAALQYQLASAFGDGLTALAAQYGVYRIAAIAATGPYQFSRAQADPNNSVTIAAGTTVQTVAQAGPAVQQFTTQAAATIAAGQTTSNVVTVQALAGGAAGNVAVNTVTVLGSAPAGITGTNTAALGSAGYTVGADVESDTALRSRSLSAIAPANTIAQLKAAAQSVPGIFAATVVDLQDTLGGYKVYACDANGALSSGLQSSVLAAVNAVGSVGLTPTVLDFTLVTQAVAANITITATAVYATVAAAVSAAITAWIDQLQPGAALLNTDLTRACFGAQPKMTAISGLVDMTVTTPTAPGLAATSTQIIRLSGTPTITLGSL
jgi:hypothetical protein